MLVKSTLKYIPLQNYMGSQVFPLMTLIWGLPNEWMALKGHEVVVKGAC